MLSRLMNAAHKRVTNVWPVKLIRGQLSAPLATFTFDDFPRSAVDNRGTHSRKPRCPRHVFCVSRIFPGSSATGSRIWNYQRARTTIKSRTWRQPMSTDTKSAVIVSTIFEFRN